MAYLGRYFMEERDVCTSMYGSETWRLTENNKRRVEATEMDALRRSYLEYQETKKLEM